MSSSPNLAAARSFLDQYAAAVSAIVEAVRPSVVRVARAEGDASQNRWRMGRARVNHGSGVVIDAAKGHILTSYHVVSGTQDVEVRFASGQTLPGKRIGKDPESDLALVQVDPSAAASAGVTLTAAELGDSATLNVGSAVIALGNPDGQRVVVTAGIVSALNNSLRGPNGQLMDGLLQTDAMFNPGMSGGPLVNSQAQIVGLNTASMNEAQGMNLAITSAMIRKVLPDLAERGAVQRPRLGITGERVQLYEGLTAHHNLSQKHGVAIHEMADNSPAAQAGVKTGDILITLAGEAITGLDPLYRVLVGHQFGDELPARLIRNLDVIEVTFKLTPME